MAIFRRQKGSTCKSSLGNTGICFKELLILLKLKISVQKELHYYPLVLCEVATMLNLYSSKDLGLCVLMLLRSAANGGNRFLLGLLVVLKEGPICCPEMSVTYLCHTTSQKSEGLNYTVMEA